MTTLTGRSRGQPRARQELAVASAHPVLVSRRSLGARDHLPDMVLSSPQVVHPRPGPRVRLHGDGADGPRYPPRMEPLAVGGEVPPELEGEQGGVEDRKSTRLN